MRRRRHQPTRSLGWSGRAAWGWNEPRARGAAGLRDRGGSRSPARCNAQPAAQSCLSLSWVGWKDVEQRGLKLADESLGVLGAGPKAARVRRCMAARRDGDGTEGPTGRIPQRRKRTNGLRPLRLATGPAGGRPAKSGPGTSADAP